MVRARFVMGIAAVGLGALVSVAPADCGDDHKPAAESQPTGAAPVTEKKADKTVIVVTGAPGQSVEVKASPDHAVSATGGAGTAGQAGAAGSAGAPGRPGQ